MGSLRLLEARRGSGGERGEFQLVDSAQVSGLERPEAPLVMKMAKSNCGRPASRASTDLPMVVYTVSGTSPKDERWLFGGHVE